MKVREDERRRRRLEVVEDMLWLCVTGRTDRSQLEMNRIVDTGEGEWGWAAD